MKAKIYTDSSSCQAKGITITAYMIVVNDSVLRGYSVNNLGISTAEVQPFRKTHLKEDMWIIRQLLSEYRKKKLVYIRGHSNESTMNHVRFKTVDMLARSKLREIRETL